MGRLFNCHSVNRFHTKDNDTLFLTGVVKLRDYFAMPSVAPSFAIKRTEAELNAAGKCALCGKTFKSWNMMLQVGL